MMFKAERYSFMEIFFLEITVLFAYMDIYFPSTGSEIRETYVKHNFKPLNYEKTNNSFNLI